MMIYNDNQVFRVHWECKGGRWPGFLVHIRATQGGDTCSSSVLSSSIIMMMIIIIMIINLIIKIMVIIVIMISSRWKHILIIITRLNQLSSFHADADDALFISSYVSAYADDFHCRTSSTKITFVLTMLWFVLMMTREWCFGLSCIISIIIINHNDHHQYHDHQTYHNDDGDHRHYDQLKIDSHYHH